MKFGKHYIIPTPFDSRLISVVSLAVAKAAVEAALARGAHVVTANKALLAIHGTQLAELSEAQYLLALKASGGRPIDAIKLASSGALAAWPELPRNIQKGQWSAFAGWTAAQVLDALFKLCHDLWAIKLGAPPRFFDEADLPKAPPARALAAWGEQLKNVARVIDHPFKQDLLLEDMLQQAKVCINSRV